VRDTRATQDYFDRLLPKVARDIAEAEQRLAEYGPVGPGNRISYFGVYRAQQHMAYALYSRGDDPAAMIPAVRQMAGLLPYFSKWSQYIHILETLNLAVLLDLDSGVFEALAETYDRLRLRDYLSDFLLQSRVAGIDYTKSTFFTTGKLRKLQGVIEADPAEQPVLMKAYLSRWYSGSSGAAFYGAHKKLDRLIYYGYWSMEAGAVAKVLGFDDRILRGRNYYPYDLVHFRPPR